MSAVGQVRDAIDTLSNIVKGIFTEDVKRQMNQVLNSINANLQDPRIKSIVDNLKRITSENGQLDRLINKASDVLGQIDNDSLKNLFSSVQQLLDSANQGQLVSESIKTIQSLDGFITIAKKLALPLTAAVGVQALAMVGLCMLQAAEVYYAYKNDRTLQEIYKAQIQNLIISIYQLRQQAAQTIQLESIRQHTGAHLNPNNTNHIQQVCQEADIILRHTAPASGIVLEAIQNNVNEAANKLIDALYQAELQSDNIDEILDRVTKAINWQTTIDYAIYGSDMPKPSYRRDQLSYSLVKTVYGNLKNSIDDIKSKLVEKFKSDGGNDLYYLIANTWADGAEFFSAIMQSIPVINSAANMGLSQEYGAPIDKLINAYRTLDTFIQQEWDTVKQRIRSSIDLTLEARQVILNRAYLEFTKETAKWFFAPYNIYREGVINGGKDAVSGLWNMVRHPIDTVTGTVTFPYDMITNRDNKRTELIKAVKTHPTRMAGGMIFSSLITSGLRVGANKLFSRAPSKVTTNNVASAPVAQLEKVSSTAENVNKIDKVIPRSIGGGGGLKRWRNTIKAPKAPTQITNAVKLESIKNAAIAVDKIKPLPSSSLNTAIIRVPLSTVNTVSVNANNIHESEEINLSIDNVNIPSEEMSTEDDLQILDDLSIVSLVDHLKKSEDISNIYLAINEWYESKQEEMESPNSDDSIYDSRFTLFSNQNRLAVGEPVVSNNTSDAIEHSDSNCRIM